MSGHNKWSTIKHKKGAADAKRGRIFTKLIKEITVAARLGGGAESGNPRLRAAIIAAKNANMPKDNIERAVKKGTGELEGVEYIETTYEGYGPGGVAVFLEVMTDNKNRTVGEVRHAFTKANGNLGQDGSVAWMFDRKGQIVVGGEDAEIDEDELMMAALEAGAEDVSGEGGMWFVTTDPGQLYSVRDAIEAAGFPIAEASVAQLPQNTVALEDKHFNQLARLLDTLEDNDDVQAVYHNAELSDEQAEQLGG